MEARIDAGENILPVSTDFFRMEAQHRIAIARILTAKRGYRLAGLQVDAWHTNGYNPCLTGTGNHGLEILAKLLTVQMAMGVDHSTLSFELCD